MTVYEYIIFLFKIPGVPVKNERKHLFNSPKPMIEMFMFKLEQSLIDMENAPCLHPNFLDKQCTTGSLTKIHVSFKNFLLLYIWHKCRP